MRRLGRPTLAYRSKPIGFVILFALLGVAYLLSTRAAAPTASFEAESAQRTNNALSASDNAASGGGYVQFGTGTTKPAQLAGNWDMVFSDEFNSSAATFAKWENNPPWMPEPHSQAVTVNACSAGGNNGCLFLRMGNFNNWIQSEVSSTGPRQSGSPMYPRPAAWQEGYFEARIRYTDNEWAWPAFWLFSLSKSQAWPNEDCRHLTAEWDMMENGVENGGTRRPAGDWFFTNLHRNTMNAGRNYCGVPDAEKRYSYNFTGERKLSNWTTWGGRWIGNQLCTYIDNWPMHCIDGYDSTAQPMHIILDMAVLGQCYQCGPKPAQLEMEVDWVRVWQQR